MSGVRVFVGPPYYVQGAGVLMTAGDYIARLGYHAFTLYDPAVADLWSHQLKPALADARIDANAMRFAGERSQTVIDRVRQRALTMRADVIIGMGGSKTMDVAKAVANDLAAPLVLIPTVASTVWSVTAHGLMEGDAGEGDRYCTFGRHPDLVLVDTAVIAHAPVRQFIAGIGDALAAHFEARANAASAATTLAGGRATIAASAVARACWETLRLHAFESVLDVRAGQVTDAVEQVVEANTLLAGIAFESGGLAAAHAVHNGLRTLPETNALLHGETVAFGVLVQLELEQAAEGERRVVRDLCGAIGLPVCFRDLGIPEITEAQLAMVAKRAMAEGETIHNESCVLSPEALIGALHAVDANGRAAKQAKAAA